MLDSSSWQAGRTKTLLSLTMLFMFLWRITRFLFYSALLSKPVSVYSNLVCPWIILGSVSEYMVA
jgi:hypothetical protein